MILLFTGLVIMYIYRWVFVLYLLGFGDWCAGLTCFVVVIVRVEGVGL